MVAAFFSAFLLRAASFCQTFTAGDSYTCGSGGRTGCVSCAVRGRGDDGVLIGVCGPQVQISFITIHPIPYDFPHLEKHFSKTKFTVHITVFQGGDDRRGYRNMCKIPQGGNLN